MVAIGVGAVLLHDGLVGVLGSVGVLDCAIWEFLTNIRPTQAWRAGTLYVLALVSDGEPCVQGLKLLLV